MAIRGYAEMIVRNLPAGDERRTDAEEILKASDRAAGLTRQLLAFSRREVITQQAVALDHLVETMQTMLQRLIGPEIQIATEIWPDLTPVLADSTQLEQILVNLVINARDAMPKGGKITVELRNVELDKIGVAAHQACSRATTSRCRSATQEPAWMPTPCRGSSSRSSRRKMPARARASACDRLRIVQQNNGAIEVQSRVGHGTTFYIYLPRATDLGPAPIQPASMASGNENHSARRR